MNEEAVQPILCAHLLRQIDAKLIELLTSLDSNEWNMQTVAPRWTVRDVAAHLLDTALRKLSMVRDGCYLESAHVQEDVIRLVNRLNQEGVTVYRRLSPRVLIGLMADICEQSARFHESLDPFAPAAFNVSWAGEQISQNWFDAAREVTERWHHQQQIRLATHRPGILVPELYYPVLDCFMRGLPYLYRDADARVGALVVIEISGECGGKWFLLKRAEGWTLVQNSVVQCSSYITIPQELAWRVFSKGIGRESARAQTRIEGNRDLGERVLQLTAIVG